MSKITCPECGEPLRSTHEYNKHYVMHRERGTGQALVEAQEAKRKCPRCQGLGKKSDSVLGYPDDPCYYCGGSGEAPDMSNVQPSQNNKDVELSVTNPQPTDAELDELVRDACSVVPVAKSEYRKRLLSWRDQHTAARVAEVVQLVHGRHGLNCDKCYNEIGLTNKKEFAAGEKAYTIAKEYGISGSVMARIRSGKVWKNIKEDSTNE